MSRPVLEQSSVVPNPSPAKAYRVGGNVKAPRLIHSVDPQFTEDARRKNLQGKCLIQILVDVNGIPENVAVVKSIADDLPAKQQRYAAGLDENAVLAVKQFRFEPATLKGQPVPVKIFVQVAFKRY